MIVLSYLQKLRRRTARERRLSEEHLASEGEQVVALVQRAQQNMMENVVALEVLLTHQFVSASSPSFFTF